MRYVRDAYTQLEWSYYNALYTLKLGICMVGSRPDAEPLEAVALIEASFLAAAAAASSAQQKIGDHNQRILSLAIYLLLFCTKCM